MRVMDGAVEVVFYDTGLYASVGAFAVCRWSRKKYRASRFIYCREQFHRVRPTGMILFHTNSKFVRCTVAFIKRIENELGLRERSKFYTTQRTTVFLMKTSSWWDEYSVRRSLLTVFLRAGRNYKSRKNNFNHTLYRGNYYLESTRPAVERFMQGYTKLRSKFCGGWVSEFQTRDEDYVSVRLVKP
jgi:hypothetical protein